MILRAPLRPLPETVDGRIQPKEPHRMATYAANTTVAPEQSRLEIERLLFKFGCSEFGVVTKQDEGAVTFVTRGVRILIKVPLPSPNDKRFTHQAKNKTLLRTESAAQAAYAQEVRSRWRSLCLLIKAKLVGVAEGATTFETEFMPYMVTPNGQTLGERFMPAIQAAQQGNGQLLLTMEKD